MCITLTADYITNLFVFLDYSRLEYCDECGWSVGVREYGHHHLCRDCVEKMIAEHKLGVCRNCGEVLPVEELNKVEFSEGDTYYYCDDCANALITTCSDCGRPIFRNDCRAYRDENGNRRYVCNSCISHYFVCERCGSLSREPLTDGLCLSCYARAQWMGSATRYGYHDWDGQWNFYNDDDVITMKPRDDVVYLGAELEVDTDRRLSVQTTVQGLDRHFHGLTHYERDGSLTSQGVEIITMPQTLSQHMKHKDVYKGAFEYLQQRGYWCNRTTGLHVHVSTGVLDPRMHNRLIYILDRYKDDVIKFSRRTSGYARYYTVLETVGGSEVTGGRLSEYRDWLRDHSGHGIYLNYGKYPKSIEFRMFQGTLDVVGFLAAIQFVYECINIVRTTTLDELRESTFNGLFKGKYEELDAWIGD